MRTCGIACNSLCFLCSSCGADVGGNEEASGAEETGGIIVGGCAVSSESESEFPYIPRPKSILPDKKKLFKKSEILTFVIARAASFQKGKQ